MKPAKQVRLLMQLHNVLSLCSARLLFDVNVLKEPIRDVYLALPDVRETARLLIEWKVLVTSVAAVKERLPAIQGRKY